jgi:hypothetical protein
MNSKFFRPFKIVRNKTELLIIPRPQLLALRSGFDATRQLEFIQFRLSLGEVTLYGKNLDQLWFNLVSGERDTIEFESPQDGEHLTDFEADLRQPLPVDAKKEIAEAA